MAGPKRTGVIVNRVCTGAPGSPREPKIIDLTLLITGPNRPARAVSASA
jgi:hypothetical protein